MREQRLISADVVWPILSVACAVSLGACAPDGSSGDEERTSQQAPDQAERAFVGTAGGSASDALIVVRQLPDACALLTQDKAQSLLKGTVVKRPQSGGGPMTSRCVYSDEGMKTDRMAGLAIMSFSLGIINYRDMAETAVVDVIKQKLGAQQMQYAGRLDTGDGAYVFKAGNEVTVWVNTGIKAPSSPVSDKLDNEVFLAASAGGYGDAAKMRNLAEDIAASAQGALENIARN